MLARNSDWAVQCLSLCMDISRETTSLHVRPNPVPTFLELHHIALVPSLLVAKAKDAMFWNVVMSPSQLQGLNTVNMLLLTCALHKHDVKQ